jgi:hypothetical protein
MEYFSKMLKLASMSFRFRFHPKCGAQVISYLAFADDIILLSRGDRQSVSYFYQQLISFGHISRLVINREKSSIYFGRVREQIKHVILQDTGFVEGSFPFQYAGRVELIKSILFGMVHFWLSIFPLPDIAIKHIVCICKNFLWTRNIFKSNSALVAWKVVCLPKKEGGLGLFDIKAHNNSFIAKQLWNIHLKSDYVWIQWIHYYYLPNVSIWDALSQRTSSPLWKSIISLKDQFVAACGSHHQAIALMHTWSGGELSFTAQSYDFLHFKCDQVS